MPERNAPAIEQGPATLTWKKQPLYDTFLTAPVGPGVAVVQFFQIPIGAIGSGFVAPGKTVNETNMNAASQLGKPNQFQLFGFQLIAVIPPIVGGATSNTDADFAAIYTSGTFRFVRGGNKVELEIPLDRIPTGPGPTGFAATAPAGVPLEAIRINNGVTHTSHYFNFGNPGKGREPLTIDSTQTFRCEIVYNGAAGPLITAAATRIKCYMLGILGSEN